MTLIQEVMSLATATGMAAVAARQVMETVAVGVKLTNQMLRQFIETYKSLGRKPPRDK